MSERQEKRERGQREDGRQLLTEREFSRSEDEGGRVLFRGDGLQLASRAVDWARGAEERRGARLMQADEGRENEGELRS